MKKWDCIIRSENGSVLIEAMIVAPILLVLLFGIADIGIMVFNKQVITNAAREGARAGIVLASKDEDGNLMRKDASYIKDVVENYCSDHLINFNGGTSVTDSDINVEWANDPSGSWDTLDPSKPVVNDYLRVTLDWDYNFLLLPNFIPTLNDSLALKARAIMRYE